MNLNRRGFLGGLISAIAAPAIVRIDNIMSVRLTDFYNTRFIWDYAIATDQMFLRVDRALHSLPVPKYVQTIPAHIAYKFIPKSLIESIRPAEHEQKHIVTAVSGRQLLEVGFHVN